MLAQMLRMAKANHAEGVYNHNLTVGSYSDKFTSLQGYNPSYGMGALSPTGFLGTGNSIIRLDWGGSVLILEVNALIPNSGWSSMKIGGTTFLRAGGSASYYQYSGVTGWSWSSVSTPFGSDGSVSAVEFTA